MSVYDVRIENHGSIVLVQPLTDTAREWLTANVGEDSMYFGGALVVEPRYLGELVDGMVSDGLNLFN